MMSPRDKDGVKQEEGKTDLAVARKERKRRAADRMAAPENKE